MTFFILQKRVLIAALIATSLVMIPMAAGAAQQAVPTGYGTPTPTGYGTPVSTGYGTPVTTGSGQPSNCGGGPCAVNNPLTVTSVCGLLKNIFNAVVEIGIPVAVLFIIWSGFKFVMALGNPKELAEAKRNFYYTIIGIAVFLGAWILAMAIAATVNAIGGANLISCQ